MWWIISNAQFLLSIFKTQHNKLRSKLWKQQKDHYRGTNMKSFLLTYQEQRRNWLFFFPRIQMIWWKMEKNIELTTTVTIKYDENNDEILLANVVKCLFIWSRMKNILVYWQTIDIMPTIYNKSTKHPKCCMM